MSHALDRFRRRVPRLQPVPFSILVPSLSMDMALRALLPPKAVSKALVDLYLCNFEKLHRILHVPIFLHQIDYFWKAPDTADLNLTATLIAVLRLGLLLSPRNGDPSLYGSPEWIYRMETQSMQLVELFLHFTTHGSRPSLEILQIQCLVVLCRMTDGSKPYMPWKLVGELLQMGIFMGLNHEPSLFPNTVSLYDGEMRRRIWTTILEIHNHVSRTSRLPLAVNSSQYNTQRPLNINDMSFIPCSAEIPVEEHWHNITDTSFQHVLSGSLALRLQLEATTVENSMDGTPALGEHCIECQLRKILRPVNSPFDVRNTVTGPPNVHSLQRVLLEMVAESSFLNAVQFSVPNPTDHDQELLNDCCRAILKLHQDPELDLASRFLVARWFRCDIVTAIILLLLSMRASRTGARELSILWKLGMSRIDSENYCC
jgi:Fungal specific transcription factor domain